MVEDFEGPFREDDDRNLPLLDHGLGEVGVFVGEFGEEFGPEGGCDLVQAVDVGRGGEDVVDDVGVALGGLGDGGDPAVEVVEDVEGGDGDRRRHWAEIIM